MWDCIFGKRKDKNHDRDSDNRRFIYPPIHPMAPIYSEPFVKEKAHKMLLACLTGGMNYEDAKEACMQEFGDEFASAKESDEKSKILYENLRGQYEFEFQKYLEEVKNGNPV